jgi:hypothetical protein
MIRASRSTTSSVTSWVLISRRSSVPLPAIWSTTPVNRSAGTRSVSTASERPPSSVRLSPPTNPPTPLTSDVISAAVRSTFSTRTMIEPV